MEDNELIDGIKKDSRMGRYGNLSNSGMGLGGFLHVITRYEAGEDKVFVEDYLEDDRVPHWLRVNVNEVDNRKIIKCIICGKPAYTLDHHWPYDDIDNKCKDCLDNDRHVHG